MRELQGASVKKHSHVNKLQHSAIVLNKLILWSLIILFVTNMVLLCVDFNVVVQTQHYVICIYLFLSFRNELHLQNLTESNQFMTPIQKVAFIKKKMFSPLSQIMGI